MSASTSTLVGDPANPYRLPAHYGDPSSEYQALQRTAIVVDRSARGRMRLAGDKSREVLTGLVTNDILGLSPGHGAYAAALTPKGRVIIDLRVYARDGELWIDGPPLAWEGWWQTVRKYINPRLARYEDLSTCFASLGIYGVAAESLLARVVDITADSLAGLPAYGHVPLSGEQGLGLIARVPDLGVSGFELWVPPASIESLRQRLTVAGAVPGGARVAEIARIEAGRPEWGIDMDDTTLAQEANMDALHAISYTKGCYTGQEAVARVHFRGHVNRYLRGLRIRGDEVPARSTAIVGKDGVNVGDVRSAVASPRFGVIALGMLRREVAAGDVVTIPSFGDGTVVELPFA